MSNTLPRADVVTLRDVNKSLNEVRETLAGAVVKLDVLIKQNAEQEQELETLRGRIDRHDKVLWYALGGGALSGGGIATIVAQLLGGG